eukprot:gb/GECG01006265.1/.p1 GENE.gb/GECG01006265.1/~~gb/GECG01006265.1/.p1  ORF type:complete len:199 (+),score=16.62 gb/GECG01006265.1/:1-597(+)
MSQQFGKQDYDVDPCAHVQVLTRCMLKQLQEQLYQTTKTKGPTQSNRGSSANTSRMLRDDEEVSKKESEWEELLYSKVLESLHGLSFLTSENLVNHAMRISNAGAVIRYQGNPSKHWVYKVKSSSSDSEDCKHYICTPEFCTCPSFHRQIPEMGNKVVMCKHLLACLIAEATNALENSSEVSDYELAELLSKSMFPSS